MKNTVIVLSCLFAAARGGALDSGDWINTVTLEVETPHLAWAKPLAGGPLKVLFVTDAGQPFSGKGMLAARMVAEWAQRMDIDHEVVVADAKLSLRPENPYLAVFDDNHGRAANLYAGTQSGAKKLELEDKLRRPYELYVFNRIAFSALPPAAKRTIVQNVLDGAGLILIHELKTDLPNLFKYPSPELFGRVAALSALAGADDPARFAEMAAKGEIVHGPNLAFSVYTQKKGRIAQIAALPEPDIGRSGQSSVYYIPEWSSMFSALKPAQQQIQRIRNEAPVPLWWGEFETLNGDFLRLFALVAGREPKVSVSCPELRARPVVESGRAAVPVKIDNPGRRDFVLAVRVRNDENRVVAENGIAVAGDNGTIDVPLPALAGGRYYLDLAARVDGKVEDFGTLAFAAENSPNIAIDIADDRIFDGRPIEFAARLSEPCPDAVLRVSLADSPYDRIWFRHETPVGEDAGGTIEVSMKDWYLPNSAAILRVELLRDGRPAAYARRMLFRPEGNAITAWTDILWGNSLTPIHGLMNFGRQGWNGVTQSLGRRRGNVPNHMAAGEIPMPWGPLNSWFMTNSRQTVSSGYRLDPETGETRPDWVFNNGASAWDATPAEIEKLDNMPADMSRRHEAVREVFRIFKDNTRAFDYGARIFNLGDETAPGYDTYRGAWVAGQFHEFLARRHGDIESLNRAWGRDYADFRDIPLLDTAEAVAQKKYPEGAAQRLFAEDNYFDVHRTIGAEIQKAAPGAYYGPNSTAHPGELDFPEINASFDHPRDITSLALRRSMRPGNLYIPLHGYAQRLAGGPARNYWECAISGAASGHMYFAANVTFDGGTLCADFRDKQPRVTAARSMMFRGLGPLIKTLDIPSSPLAVVTSYPSWKANIFAAEFTTTPAMSGNPLIEYGNARGYNFDYYAASGIVGDKGKERLGKYRVLFLAGLSALDEAAAAAIVDFARAGGTVVADLNPGIFNEHLGVPEKNMLAELFGDLKPAPINGANDHRGLSLPGVAGVEPMRERAVGKGRAILMNFTLAGLIGAQSAPGGFNEFMDGFMEKLGLEPLVESRGLPEDSMIRLSRGGDFDMIAFANNRLSAEGKAGGEVSVAFPRDGFIYEPWHGSRGRGKSITVPFDPPYRFLASFAVEQEAPPLKLDAAAATPGRALSLGTDGLRAGRVYNVEIYDPRGGFAVPRNEVGKRCVFVAPADGASFPLHFSYSDPKGDYKIVLTDVATGLSSSTVIRLE